MMYKYCSLAIALLAGSASANPFAAKTSTNSDKAAFHAGIMGKAVPTKNSQIRKLDGAEEVDLSGYSLKFEKCQFVKGYSQEAVDENADDILATSRFVIFRLCPTGNCKSCNSNYGEYIVSMDDYLEQAVEYRMNEQEEYCEECQETCNYQGDDDGQAQGDDGAAEEEEEDEAQGDDAAERKLANNNGIDCDSCSKSCAKIDNMEDNFYLDATNFINCQQIQDENDDGAAALYAGPICASNGYKIKIGVFTDEDCLYLDSSKNVEDYLNDGDGNEMKLSHALLKTTYDSSDCISCLDDAGDDDAGNVETKEVCEDLYQEAGKCEKTHGFSSGMYANNYYADQQDNEELVCDYISSITSGTYSQEGEIVIGGSKIYTSGGTSTTGGQKFALTFFIIGTVGLAVYSAMLHSQLTKGGGKADLAQQGGAMA